MPGLRYADAAAGLEWLGEAFRLTEHLRWTDPATGRVHHAEMRYGDGAFIELSDSSPNAGLLVLVADTDEHFRAHRAEIIDEPSDGLWGGPVLVSRPRGTPVGFRTMGRDVPREEWGATVARG
jgi:uncharacterized glyoxalase superfamily protein PhnB